MSLKSIFFAPFWSFKINVSVCFWNTGFGNVMANESPFRQAQSIVWYRYHNYKANLLAAKHPDWTDEVLFQNTRKWVIAVYQVTHSYTFLLFHGTGRINVHWIFIAGKIFDNKSSCIKVLDPTLLAICHSGTGYSPVMN